MKLYHSPPSPFSRKARIVASVLGLDKRIELVVADTNNPDDALRGKNPLGKIPTLELDTGACVYDSAVIVACLDQLAGGGKVIPLDGEARIAALTLEALADGVMDACILQIYEMRMRAERRGLRARLPRPALRQRLARRSSASGRVAGQIRRRNPGL